MVRLFHQLVSVSWIVVNWSSSYSIWMQWGKRETQNNLSSKLNGPITDHSNTSFILPWGFVCNFCILQFHIYVLFPPNNPVCCHHQRYEICMAVHCSLATLSQSYTLFVLLHAASLLLSATWRWLQARTCWTRHSRTDIRIWL
jgi:hypothetical protein